MKTQIKNYDQSFLYGKADYGNELFQYIMKADRIDKSSAGFDDIKYLIKRNQITSCLSSLLDRQSLVLMLPAKPLPRAFKVFAGKDVREDKNTKVFIDCSEIIKYQNGTYVIKQMDIDKFISYLACALNTIIYHTDPTILLNNTQIVNSSTEAFAKLCSNIIDYMRIGGVDNIRPKMLYMASLYYQVGILKKDDNDTADQKAIKFSKLSKREAELIRVQIPTASFDNINTFVQGIAKVLRVEDSLKLDNFIDKWLFLYGSGTQFATEIYTAFANLLINAYVGAYLNNQKQIEKIAGRSMVEYCNVLFRIGGEVL